MIRLAEVSFWHWMQFEEHTAENEAIGLWQLARVYALAGESETALGFAIHYQQVALDHELGPFHESYAFEALARAYEASGDSAEKEAALVKAWDLARKIKESESRKMVEADLKTLASSSDH